MNEKWNQVLINGFKKIDDEVGSIFQTAEMEGTTAVVSACQIISSNCGDCRAILCRKTQTIPLSLEHKPDRADELSTIASQGGKVINWNSARVMGVLSMSRAIGDKLMSPFVIPVPETIPRTDEDECLILASDGLWDVLSNDEVGDVARCILRRPKRKSKDRCDISPAQLVADCLTQLAFERNSTDNISVIVVDLKSRKRHQSKP